MTKGKVIQIGVFVSFLGLISYELAPQVGIDNFTASTISSTILIFVFEKFMDFFLNLPLVFADLPLTKY